MGVYTSQKAREDSGTPMLGLQEHSRDPSGPSRPQQQLRSQKLKAMRRGFLNNPKRNPHTELNRGADSESDIGPITTAKDLDDKDLPVVGVKKSVKSTVPSVEILSQTVATGRITENLMKRHAQERLNQYEWISFPPNAVAVGEPVAECVFLPGTKQVLFDMPGFPQPLPPPPTNPAYCVASIPGKGLGLIATRALKQGELILTERPLLVRPRSVTVFVPPSFDEKQTTQHALDERERITKPALARMTEDRRDAFFKLHNSRTDDGAGPINGIVATNGLEWTNLHPGLTGGRGDYTAVCDLISRLNHSCSPNTQATYSRVQFAFNIYAVRNIAQGEELTFHPTDFICDCPFCAGRGDAEHVAESNARRTTIRGFSSSSLSLLHLHQKWIINTNPSGESLPDDWLVRQYLEQLVLLEKEGLQSCDLYCLLPQAIMGSYIMLADAKRASKWAAVVNRRCWVDDHVPADEYLGPKSPAYQKNPAWGLPAMSTFGAG
ncbi:SET domain-containing protein [Mycena chlorophos]|uniref:SET domain-containing protein n=1 Tax=Mycena chlorophos TaxID=658473 RepID=A0A8H6VQM3_MYCCL|nr:SET domain-containing protein [Mycena chlorophos]